MASRQSRVSTLITLVAMAAATGCQGTTDPPKPPPPAEFDVSVVVQGTVLDLQAQPVFGATVRISVYRFEAPTCTTQLVGPTMTATVTEEGMFSQVMVYTVADPGVDYVEACLTVEALPPTGYYADSRSNLRAQLKRLVAGVEVVGPVDLVLEPTAP
jgi:hypothetical protein